MGKIGSRFCFSSRIENTESEISSSQNQSIRVRRYPHNSNHRLQTVRMTRIINRNRRNNINRENRRNNINRENRIITNLNNNTQQSTTSSRQLNPYVTNRYVGTNAVRNKKVNLKNNPYKIKKKHFNNNPLYKFECCVCYSKNYNKKKFIKCNHNLCKNCYIKISTPRKCPLCRINI
ncbi:hypothetical protein CPAV1605_1175 [seawater metagenome]|uniref:RING-type domain-containing protein n=1 Tax=seawater metagenome TaxID=1561972 RepID=A0A5E8CKX4_9ZZZZ